MLITVYGVWILHYKNPFPVHCIIDLGHPYLKTWITILLIITPVLPTVPCVATQPTQVTYFGLGLVIKINNPWSQPSVAIK